MSYKTILAHLELNGDNEGVLAIAAQLGERFGSRVIGIAAARPFQPLYDEGLTMGDVITREREDLEKALDDCQKQFRKALEHRVKQIGWRSEVTVRPLADYIADEARCADLIVTGKDIGASLFDNTRRVNIGNLAVRAGRPVLIVPQGITRLNLQHVFLGWKETRESRRAAADGIPLLEMAGHVTVLEVTSDRDQECAEAHLKDVASWLEQHKVSARPLVVGTISDKTGYLRAELLNHKCDLLIAGAYGHNRLGEWVFGGVTEEVLLDPDFCVLLSH